MPDYGGATYNWTVSGDATNVTGNFTRTVSWDADASITGSVILQIQVDDSASTCSVTNSTTVTVYENPDCSITVLPEVCAESTGNTASVANAGVGAIYNWTEIGRASCRERV